MDTAAQTLPLAQKKHERSVSIPWLRPAEWWARSWLAKQLVERMATPEPPKTVKVPRVIGARPFRVDVGTQELAAWEWGEGETVLLIHGWSGWGAQMQAFVEPLVASGHHVVTVDLPAHGQSPGRRATLPLLADTIEQLVNHFDAKAIIAHSFGAAATVYALANGMSLERVAFIAPAGDFKLWLNGVGAMFGLEKWTVHEMQEVIEREVGPMHQLNILAHAPAMAVPALFVHDKTDGQIPWKSTETIARFWEDAELVLTEGHGHNLVLKNPEVVAKTAAFVTSGE